MRKKPNGTLLKIISNLKSNSRKNKPKFQMKGITKNQLYDILKGADLIKGITGINEDNRKVSHYINPETLTLYRVKVNPQNNDLYDLGETKYEDLVKKSKNNSGYLLCTVGKTRTFHSIVANTFVKKPDDFDEKEYHIDHIDGNKMNNYPSNLRWVTRSENMRNFYDNNKKHDFGKYYYGFNQLHLDGKTIDMSLEEYINYRKRNNLSMAPVRKALKRRSAES